jgi:hypothetical protein
MRHDNVLELKKLETFFDPPLTQILLQGAKRLLGQAPKAKIETYIFYSFFNRMGSLYRQN